MPIKRYNGTTWDVVAGDGSQGATGATGATGTSALTTKGDLLAYSTTPARLGVGTDGSVLQADSTAATGLSWAGPSVAAGKNALINGGFDIWQRGTSFTPTASIWTYTADRWSVYPIGASVTISRSTSLPTGATSQYSALITGNTSVTTLDFNQYLEQSIVYAYLGKVTYSAWIYNNTGSAITPVIYWGTPNSANQTLGVGITYQANDTLQSCANGAWTKVSATRDISVLTNITNGLYVDLEFASGTFNSNTKSVNIAQAQLELGSVATAFSRAAGTLQGELAACQRYYWRSTPGGAYSAYGNGGTISTTGAYIAIPFPVFMRTNPSSIEYANLAIQTSGGTLTGLSSLTIDQGSPINISLYGAIGSTWTANQPCRMVNNNNTAGYVGFSAEL
jgi:hypothetical protein